MVWEHMERSVNPQPPNDNKIARLLGSEVRERRTYDIDYVLDQGDECECALRQCECVSPPTRRKRLTVVDPDPQPGYGPSIGTVQRQLRESDPEEFGLIQDPGELVIVSMTEVTKGEA